MEDSKIDVHDLYEHVTQEIRWGKQQQWQLTHYAVLLFGAIHLLYSLARDECIADRFTLAVIASGIAWLSLIFGATVVAQFQTFLVKNRAILRAIYRADSGAPERPSYVSDGFVRIRGHRTLRDTFSADVLVWGGVLAILIVATWTVQVRVNVSWVSWMIGWAVIDLPPVALVLWYYRRDAEKERNRSRQIP